MQRKITHGIHIFKALIFLSLMLFPIYTQSSQKDLEKNKQESMDNKKLTLKTIFEQGRNLLGAQVRGLKFLPDGKAISFLKGDQKNPKQLNLWVQPLSGGKAKQLIKAKSLSVEERELSATERARRERQRITHRGITTYYWDPSGKSVLIPYNGKLYYIHKSNPKNPVELIKMQGNETDIRFSPSGHHIGFIRNQNLYFITLRTKKETAVTKDGGGEILNGMAEFIAQEEMGRRTGYWFSPKDDYIAYTKVDEKPVDLLKRLKINASGLRIDEQRYPRSGRPNAQIALYLYNLKTKKHLQIDLGQNQDIYLARVNWGSDNQLYVQRQNRKQTELDLLTVNLKTGKTKTILQQKDPYWINLNQNFRPLKEGGFLWTSEETGYCQINFYDKNGNKIRTVTKAPGLVTGIKAVDEKKGLVYYEGHKRSPLENHLYVVSYLKKNSEPLNLTPQEGWWLTILSPNKEAFIGIFQNPLQPPQTGLYNTRNGKLIRWLNENRLDQNHPYFPYLKRHSIPEYGVLKTKENIKLYYEILKPPHFNPKEKYPAIISVYGGPHVQIVRKSWGSLLDQVYLNQGFVIFKLDNRGSTNRGKAFETVIHKNMSDYEVKDQLLGLQYLKSLPYIDKNRIGVKGWSYGGYMTLMLMLKAPEAFAAGVAGAPVTDWSLYDTHYTERYMSTPSENPKGYQSASVLTYADKLKNPLLLIHGMADDNVFLDNSLKIIDKWQKNNVSFDLMLYPGQTHGFINKKREHVTYETLKFFEENLKK